MFDANALHEGAINTPPFMGQHDTIVLERQEDTPNRFHFEHEAIVSIAIRNYPLEHWNRERMFYAIGPFANPHSVDPVCLQGVDFSAVLMQVKAKDATDIPLVEYFKNHSGLGAYARISITDIGALDEDLDSDDSGPCSPDPGNAAQLGGALGLGDAPGPHGAPPAPAMGAADGPALAQPGGLGASGPPQDSAGPGAPEHMSVRDILPVPVGRLRGSTIIPSVEAHPLLVKTDTVDITLRAGSFYEIRVTGHNNYVGVYRVPLQPVRSGLRGD
jgi:hypothetical protein